MTTAQAIAQGLRELPEAAQREVLDFVEFLRRKTENSGAREHDETWSGLSLVSAMRGMEDEEAPYTIADLKKACR